MNYKKIIIGAALTLACFSCLPVNALTSNRSTGRCPKGLLDRQQRQSDLLHQRHKGTRGENSAQRVCQRHESGYRLRS